MKQKMTVDQQETQNSALYISYKSFSLHINNIRNIQKNITTLLNASQKFPHKFLLVLGDYAAPTIFF